jgi:hypothetical protein
MTITGASRFLAFVFRGRGHLTKSQGIGYANVALIPTFNPFAGVLRVFTVSISLSILTTFILMGLSGSFRDLPVSADNY